MSDQTVNKDWDRIAQSADYRRMMTSKTKFVVAATLFFLIYYFTLPVLVGYWPELMKREVIGVVNVAYLFAFSQFLMTWILAYLYMRISRRFDLMTEKILAETLAAKEAE
jgi:uncharacterized membrane protein (DUF485 family)